jgi:glycosyltransferase involved in cell wall biosynthesis
MRVVYLADAPYIHTRRWLEHFARAGWETHVISFRPAEIDGVRVHYVAGLERLGRLRYLARAGRVRRLVRELEPDVLHALHLTSYGFLAALCDIRPTVTSVWGTDILEAPGWSPFHYAITRYALAKADHVTACGLRLANATLRYAPRAKPITVVPYGVDLARFRPVARADAGAGNVAVGAVARLSREKGLDLLLRAAARVVQDGTPLRVVLAGDGPERDRLVRLAARLGIADRVDFRGEVPHDQVPGVLAGLDVFVMPSRAEGFGVAALEAQAMEVPVVASGVHGIPDVIDDGRTGILVPPGNIEALAAAIVRLATDPALRAAMGHAGRAFVEERYRWQENAAQMERLYHHLLAPFTHGAARATVPESP